MALNNTARYTKTVIDWELMNSELGGFFRVVSQRPYKGKPEAGLAPGVTFTLQVIEDKAPPIIDKATGHLKENNVFETFEATVVGQKYPASFRKGDYVELDGFMPEASFYIDFSLILRFQSIRATNAPKDETQEAKGGLKLGSKD